MAKEEKAFNFLKIMERTKKPREAGITEIRDMQMGLRQLEDLCEVAGEYIDILKFTAGGQRLMSREYVRKKIELCKKYNIQVSSGGFLERVILQGPEAVVKFMEESKELGFTHIEVSSGILIISLEQKLELIKLVKEYGLHAMPEVAMAYGITPESDVTINEDKLLWEIDKSLEAGSDLVMIESEGITEEVKEWRTDIIFKIIRTFGLKKLMFEAADPLVFDWYIKNFGSDVNMFVDNSQIMFVEEIRSGVWGREGTWGRVATFRRK